MTKENKTKEEEQQPKVNVLFHNYDDFLLCQPQSNTYNNKQMNKQTKINKERNKERNNERGTYLQCFKLT